MLRYIERDMNTKMNISVLIVTLSKKKEEMNHLVAKMHAQPSSNKLNVCPICKQEFSSFYSLQEHGAKQQKPSDTVAELNSIVEEEGEDGEKI